MTTDEKNLEKIKIGQELLKASANIDNAADKACSAIIEGRPAGKFIDELERLFNVSIKAMRDADKLNVGVTDVQVN
jgi:hypothetical protein